MSEAEFIIFGSLNTHQVLIIVVDTRILGCVADSLQQRRFAGISPTDYKDAKSSIFRSEVIWIKGKRETSWECRSHGRDASCHGLVASLSVASHGVDLNFGYSTAVGLKM
jgi:hypothetical protein